jgi:hypothetical protein
LQLGAAGGRAGFLHLRNRAAGQVDTDAAGLAAPAAQRKIGDRAGDEDDEQAYHKKTGAAEQPDYGLWRPR